MNDDDNGRHDGEVRRDEKGRLLPGSVIRREHGAYSPVRCEQRAEELADGIRAVTPMAAAADENMIRVTGMTLARVERVMEALNGDSDNEELHRVASTWVSLAGRNLDRRSFPESG